MGNKQKKGKKKSVLTNRNKSNKNGTQRSMLFGGFIVLSAALLLLGMVSYLFWWKVDYSTLGEMTNPEVKPKNLLNKFGAYASHLLIYRLFGLSSFLPVITLFYTGLRLIGLGKGASVNTWARSLGAMLFLSVSSSFFYAYFPLLSGQIGLELNQYAVSYIGSVGLVGILCFLLFWFVTTNLNYFKRMHFFFRLLEVKNLRTKVARLGGSRLKKRPISPSDHSFHRSKVSQMAATALTDDSSSISMEIEPMHEEGQCSKNAATNSTEQSGYFNPKLSLSRYEFPAISLLKNYGGRKGIMINQTELEANKNNIVETLSNYGIAIAQIKATIGSTVTLYEIIPTAGTRISKIKGLENDIALSLSALGIRIIAPIPGKGTIGIEVPNQHPAIVSMHAVIASEKFQKAEMDIPLALGKTISNETFLADLTKMPHLLMAGATGQGKSVGLNAILTSILFKKHPSEVKLVLIDPKKVELTTYNGIEKHYLAKLPDCDECVITDNNMVVHTLKSLCLEMDNRYELLKKATCRNIKEYNQKFKERKLNPNKGYTYLPYIVVIIDEFADLIMTAGREVETPIARLAQLARAVGLHLIIATQRPSVNVITGLIKANFPARVAFRVSSKVDSRTIIDTAGAEQLIGRGDMLYTQGSDIVRLQCAFIDTPEVEKVVSFINAQAGFAQPHLLPKCEKDETEEATKEKGERDALFREAAEIIIAAQQGSASLLQRKLKLGYNRAGRLIDQMEAAGIVGAAVGSKPRQVLITDFASLDKQLNQHP